ncbi:hypothetical protein BX659_101105 [Orenia metallireducens]|uniref:Uncharacterized protein n=1 Tax=Orenia metallireducens TaxID=1413210 RepID=A0A285FXC0_9FIRM|nr:hypothetical protein [Orenia metallireducens]PRX35612.1 hypothetical protein BX659_101105 [Orenia metallireducens]SNY15733.1 hypothetical protein SAMN06265827_10386 [Orenia metallireducens]
MTLTLTVVLAISLVGCSGANNTADTGAYPEQIKTSFISGNDPDIMVIKPGSGSKALVTFKDAGRGLDLIDIYQEKR